MTWRGDWDRLSLIASTLGEEQKCALPHPKTVCERLQNVEEGEKLSIASVLMVGYDLRGASGIGITRILCRERSMSDESNEWYVSYERRSEIMQNRKNCLRQGFISNGITFRLAVRQMLRFRIQLQSLLSGMLKAWLGQMVNRSEMVDLGVVWLDVEALINYHNV